jgi:UvrD-like helicase family protein
VVIVNCSEGVLPNESKPEKERFRDLARFYVAMTRAKNQLVISYTEEMSTLLEKSRDDFLLEDWSEYNTKEILKSFGKPLSLEAIRHPNEDGQAQLSKLDLTGSEFLYCSDAVGLPSLLIDKLRNLIDGKGLIRAGARVKWKDIRQAKQDTTNEVKSRQAFGPEGINQFRELVKKIEISEV